MNGQLSYRSNRHHNSLEGDPATLSNVWDEEHDALNMVLIVVCNELDGVFREVNLLRNLHKQRRVRREEQTY
jgi:hypothetical protein